MSNFTPFSNYVNSLLTNTLDGIIASEADSIEKINEIKNSVNLDDEEFANRFISDDNIREQILFTFPSGKLNISTIDEGQVYQMATSNEPENPAIEKELSYKMTKEDFEIRNNVYLITKTGYEHLFISMKKKYIFEKRIIIKQLIYRGIPNVHVNGGEISAPFSVQQFNINDTFGQFVQGLRYKCYKRNVESKLCYFLKEPFKDGICKYFYVMQPEFTGADLVTFEGYLQISSSDEYTFNLLTSGSCIIEIDFKKLLSYDSKLVSNNIYLNQGFHHLYIICDISALQKGLYITYSTTEITKSQKVSMDMLYYLIEKKYNQSFIYNNKQGELEVSVTDGNNLSAGEVKLFYRIDYE